MTYEEKQKHNKLRQKLRYYMGKYNTTFSVKNGSCVSHQEDMIFDTDGNSREMTINELEELISKYKEIDLLIDKLTEQTCIVY